MEEKPASYFEGVLQLRNISDEALDWLHDEIIRAGRARIAKAKEVKGGVDLYLSSQHYMQTLGRKLQQKFGGILKITSKIHTKDFVRSRDVHRLTVLFRQLPFKTGDVIKYQGEEWKIIAVGNQVQLRNVKSGKKIRVLVEKLL